MERDFGSGEVVAQLGGRRVDVAVLEQVDEGAVALDLFGDVAPNPVQMGQTHAELGAVRVCRSDQPGASGEADQRAMDLEMGLGECGGVEVDRANAVYPSTAVLTARRCSSVARRQRRSPADSIAARARLMSDRSSVDSSLTATPLLGTRTATPSDTSIASASRIVLRPTRMASDSATSRNGVPGARRPAKMARRTSSAARSTVDEYSSWRSSYMLVTA